MKMNLASPFPIILDNNIPRQKIYEILNENPVELFKFITSEYNKGKGINLRYHRRRYSLEPELFKELLNKPEVIEYITKSDEREEVRRYFLHFEIEKGKIIAKLNDEIDKINDDNNLLNKAKLNCSLDEIINIKKRIEFNSKIILSLKNAISILIHSKI